MLDEIFLGNHAKAANDNHLKTGQQAGYDRTFPPRVGHSATTPGRRDVHEY